MHRVMFDSSAEIGDPGYVLWFETSRRELEAIGDELRDGLRVILYMPDDPEDLELEAILQFVKQMDCWKGIPLR